MIFREKNVRFNNKRILIPRHRVQVQLGARISRLAINGQLQGLETFFDSEFNY